MDIHTMKKEQPQALPEDLHASLTVIDGPDRGKIVRIRTKQVVIGRKECDLVLNDSKISAQHAKVVWRNRAFLLVDLQSTNGTYVGQLPIREHVLSSMDQIRIGFSVILFRLDPDSSATLQEISSHQSHQSGVGTSTPTIAEFIQPSKTVEIALTVLNGPYRGERHLFTRESIVIGRVHCDMVLANDVDVSRKHAVIEVIADDQIFLRDLTSANGTFLNGVRISNQRVRSGNEITVGSSTMRITFKTPETK